MSKPFTSETREITLWMYSDDADSGKGKKASNINTQQFFVNISKNELNRIEKAFSLQGCAVMTNLTRLVTA